MYRSKLITGCGAWHRDRWFQIEWDVVSRSLPIAVKELLPIVLACELWGPLWVNQRVRCHCDNQVVVACLRSRTSKNHHCMHMLRALAFVEARHRFMLQPAYINTKLNHLADDLSRNNLPSFLSKAPGARREPDHPSSPLLTLLLDPEVDWISGYWHRQFEDIFRRFSHPQPDAPMRQQ